MRGVVLTLLCVVIIYSVEGQTKIKYSHIDYALSIGTTSTGSGHGTNYSFNFNAQDKSRMFEIGFLYNQRKQRIKGAEIKYKWFLPKNNHMLTSLNIRTFIMYNLIYQTERSNQVITLTSEGEMINIKDDNEGIVATMEHYAGMGIIANIGKNFYAESSVGLGTYIGSLDKQKDPGTFGIHKQNKGYTSTFKLGFGILF